MGKKSDIWRDPEPHEDMYHLWRWRMDKIAELEADPDHDRKYVAALKRDIEYGRKMLARDRAGGMAKFKQRMQGART